MKAYKLSTGKSIHVIDDAFTMSQVMTFEGFANGCLYRLLHSVDSYMSKSNGERFFGSILSDVDVKSLGIFETAGFTSLSGMFNNKKIMRSWILCTTPSTKYLYHTDDTNNSSLTFLYYINGYWHPEWGGETIFCNETGEPEIAVACKPNRIVIFPSNIHHKPTLTTGDSKPRFTFTTTFIDIE
jgi:hypothetical protein